MSKYRADQFPAIKNDAAQLFFARELEEIDGQMYDVKYAALEAFELVNPKKLNAATETYTWRSFDGRGVAKMSSSYATGSPRVDVDGVEESATVRPIRDSYGYNVQEIRAAQQAGRPLDSMRAIQARRAINELINEIALLGSVEHKLNGLFKLPNSQIYTVPAVGNSNGGTNSTKWIYKTGEQILDDLYGMVDQVETVTKNVEHVKRLCLPYERLRYISRLKAYSDNSSKETVLQIFKENRPTVEIRGALYLESAGPSGVMRAMGYNPDPTNVELLLPIPFESFPPQLDGLEYVVECHARMGGVVCRYPLTVIYADDI